MEVGEALDVEHVHLVDEQNARNQLSEALIDVLVHHLVDLPPQLVCDLGLLWLHQLSHHRHDILATLGPSIGHVQVM